jgi:hypothetical protein
MVGFWLIGNINLPGDYIAQTASASNIALIPPDENRQFGPRIQKAAAHGLKSLLMAQWILFDGVIPLPDYQSRFDNMWSSLGESQSDVVGFYLLDEPYTHASAQSVTDQQVKAGMDAVAAYIREKAPGRPILMTEAHLFYDRPDFASLIPALADYIGVNCYLAFGPPCAESNISAQLARIVANKQAHQKLIITADGYWPTTPTMQEDLALRSRIMWWQQMLGPYFVANQVGAFTPFIYQTVPAANVRGLEEAPFALAEMKRYMTSLRNGAAQPAHNLAKGKNVLASGTYAENVPGKAVDGELAGWNAGGYAPQWIQIDLEATRTIADIRLIVGQTPAGATKHLVYGSATGADGDWQLLHEFQGETTNGQTLVYSSPTPLSGIRYVKIETIESPSWVAWPEIEVVGW